MGFRRSIDRNVMKSWMKTNRINEEWNKFQIQKYGLGNYEEIQRKNRKKR